MSKRECSHNGHSRDRRIRIVADSENHLIQKFDSNGNFITKWGSTGTGDGQFYCPNDITIDSSNGYVYVTDSGNHRIQIFVPDIE
jgi:DNA-binding beta-propeller fold protein YncE